jgi:hypothetical protein
MGAAGAGGDGVDAATGAARLTTSTGIGVLGGAKATKITGPETSATR